MSTSHIHYCTHTHTHTHTALSGTRRVEEVQFYTSRKTQIIRNAEAMTEQMVKNVAENTGKVNVECEEITEQEERTYM